MKRFLFLSAIVQSNSIWSFYSEEDKIDRVSKPRNIVTQSIFALDQKSLAEILRSSEHEVKTAFDFNGQTIGPLDLSGIDFHNVNFGGATFNKTNLSKADLQNVRLNNTVFNGVSLRGADLRNIFSDQEKFQGCVFKNMDLGGALLFGNDESEYLFIKGKGRISNLVCQFLDLRKKIDNKRDQGLLEEEKILNQHLKIIKNVMVCVDHDFESIDIEYDESNDLTLLYLFELIDFGLKGINLGKINLPGMWLTKDVKIPEYDDEDLTPLFNLWLNSTGEEGKRMQTLLNHGTNLFRGVSKTLMREVDWKTKDLRNVNFSGANLKKCNFIGVDLKGIDLEDINLSGVRLTENVRVPKYEDYHTSPLFNLWMNGNDEEQQCMQTLLNHCKVNLFFGVDNDLMKEVIWKDKNIENADFFGIDLRGCDFRGVNFKGVSLRKANLTGLRLSENVYVPEYDCTILFKWWTKGDDEHKQCVQTLMNCGIEIFTGIDNALMKEVDWSTKKLQNVHFSGADLSGCNLENTDLYGVSLLHANLQNTRFKGANLKTAFLDCSLLYGANFEDADLKETSFAGAILEDANFENADLEEANIMVTTLQSKPSSELNIEALLYYDKFEEDLKDIYRNTAYNCETRKLAKQIAIGKCYDIKDWDEFFYYDDSEKERKPPVFFRLD